MLLCSCNLVTTEEIKSVIIDLLDADPFQFIVPLQVYHEMGKRGRCCGCFPALVNLIYETTEAYHRKLEHEESQITEFLDRLKDKHEQCETARMLERRKRIKHRAA